MYGFRSAAIVAAALLSCSVQGNLPYQQGPPGYASDHDGHYQKIPSSTHNSPSGMPQPYGYEHPKYPNPTGAVPYSPTGTASPIRRRPNYLYGTNAGGHLILEKWMTPDIFEGTNATDQYTFDQTDGAAAKLKKHWESYYTRDDFVAMRQWGLNAVRIPIGFWAYDNAGTPYIQGADAYLERMIEWCRELGLWVLVDCHGSPGSQNGFDNSGHAGEAHWQTDDNLARSTRVLRAMAAKYGAMKYADVVWGLQMVNEPISWDNNNLNTTQSWTERAYPAVRAAAENKQLSIVMHDGFMGPSQWTGVGRALASSPRGSKGPARFVLDTHLYQNQAEEDKQLTQREHIAKACAWRRTSLLPQNSSSPAAMPVIVGEFSAATDVCANPDGSTLAGSACYVDGCQCANNVDIGDWQKPLKEATRMFFEAELEAFDQGAQGWFVWSWKGPGGWGMENLIREGVVGKQLNDRKYKDQCD